MKTFLSNGQLKEKLIKLYEENAAVLSSQDSSVLSGIRAEAFQRFSRLSFPTAQMENWKDTDLTSTLGRDYHHYLRPAPGEVDMESLFTCRVHDLETDQVSFLNGWHAIARGRAPVLPEGVILCSLAEAIGLYPGLIERHYARCAVQDDDTFLAMNTAFAQDGMFLYIPDGVRIETPVQMISIINHHESLLVQSRNLIILGNNSQVTLVQCDDSTNQQSSLINSVTEAVIGSGAVLTHYKLQNLNDQSSLINSTFFHLEAGSTLNTFALSLNGGLIRNQASVRLNGQGASADIFGLYLMDKKQHVDNRVFVDHAAPGCHSNELFKGILDDEAGAVFNGHILVRRGAQKTNAYQNNRNILLTDKARAHAMPFLEIYADDVKCSHGATVGQLDPQALFYIRSRGICMASARLLLMYAFAAEVISRISIGPLKDRIDEMIRQRLRGELHICDRCVLHCSNQEKEITFDIDLSKV